MECVRVCFCNFYVSVFQIVVCVAVIERIQVTAILVLFANCFGCM